MFRDLLLRGLTLAKLKWHFSIFYENHPFPSPPLYGSVLWTNIKQKKQGWFLQSAIYIYFSSYQYLGRHGFPSSSYCTHSSRGSAAKSIRHSSDAKTIYTALLRKSRQLRRPYFLQFRFFVKLPPVHVFSHHIRFHWIRLCTVSNFCVGYSAYSCSQINSG